MKKGQKLGVTYGRLRNKKKKNMAAETKNVDFKINK
jgi:hypothetical protein